MREPSEERMSYRLYRFLCGNGQCCFDHAHSKRATVDGPLSASQGRHQTWVARVGCGVVSPVRGTRPVRHLQEIAECALRQHPARAHFRRRRPRLLQRTALPERVL